MTRRPEPSGRISLLVSDVDGTLVDPQKQLAPATLDAVERLRAAGVHFAIVSSRPPRGMTMVAEPLKLELFAGFNGGEMVRGDLSPVEAHFVPLDAARSALDMIRRYNAGIWVFADGNWFITDADGDYVDHERHTVRFDPVVVTDFGEHLARAGKIVGASKDFEALARCETELQGLLGPAASVHLSQSYYLDITHPEADKGHAVRSFARHFGVPLEEVAVIGDMANDLPMFEVAGLSVAMGNATAAVKARGDFVTTSNAEDGVARAIEQWILPRAS